MGASLPQCDWTNTSWPNGLITQKSLTQSLTQAQCRLAEFLTSLAERERAGHIDLPPTPELPAHRSLYLIPASEAVGQPLQVRLSNCTGL